MTKDHVVVGHFKNRDDIVKAIKNARKNGNDSLELFTPYPDHHLEEVMYEGKKRSPVRRVVLTGALTGCLGAFLMTSWMALDYPVRVGAKPLLSYPSFVIIGFECTILIGSLFNVAAVLFFAGLPYFKRNAGFRPNFTEGTYGLALNSSKEECEKIKEVFGTEGAHKVEVNYVR